MIAWSEIVKDGGIALGVVLAVWNRLGIRSLDIRTDGLQIKWNKAEKALSHAEGHRQGVEDEQGRDKTL